MMGKKRTESFYQGAEQLDILLSVEKPTRKDMDKVLVIIKGDEALAIYFFERNKKVAWLSLLKEAGEFTDVPVIISSSNKTSQLQPYLEESHLLEYYELRPGILLVLHIEKNLWEEFLQKKKVN